MNNTNVSTTDGTGRPRRCMSQTASGSIDAATSEVASILRGVVGMIIDETRMTTMFHDSCRPDESVIAVLDAVLISATATAFTTKNKRPMSVFVWDVWRAYRT